ncbi:hypothetical protein ACFQ3P_41475 [Paraburkholderia sabiae]|uniref:PRC-barrel domain-containing protein n=1 Tax=Paraburkholderia sabiae TaxID=273251 RepID=A0ABU9QRN1_9BURK|nr:hypothetical protein [Paraburkholderia sabiae]WJZ79320.1 hypothetical protein QEN71_41550 [Paraburkholderia sabiae]CAD6563054.1 hypothetical protein LMG24235_08296 [Paraburkholderia sabiae]
MTQINIDLLVGQRVLTREGVTLGRIEAIKIVRDRDAWLVSEFHIGPGALLERLAIGLLPGLLREAMERRARSHRQRISWNQIDLSDPRHPRLVCDEAALRRQ